MPLLRGRHLLRKAGQREEGPLQLLALQHLGTDWKDERADEQVEGNAHGHARRPVRRGPAGAVSGCAAPCCGCSRGYSCVSAYANRVHE